MKSIFLLGALLTSTSFAVPLTSVLHWGRYTVTVVAPSDSSSGRTVATIREGRSTLVTLKDQGLGASLEALHPGGLPELVLSGFSGGAHCCVTYTMFSQDAGRLEQIGRLDAGDYGATFRDLDGDGTKEIIYHSNALTSYDFSFAASPSVETVIGWNGTRLVDRTRRFFRIPWNASRSYKQDLLSGTAPEMLRGPLSGYYGNMVLAGQGLAAETYLRTTIFPRQPILKAWFDQNRRGLLKALHDVPESSLEATPIDQTSNGSHKR